MRSLASFTQTQKAFAIFGVILLVLLGLGAYGYFSGAWEEATSPTTSEQSYEPGKR